ncbi:MAG: PilX N-terminal domain-containing pilus assembly protein [Hydrogenophaga sp.]
MTSQQRSRSIHTLHSHRGAQRGIALVVALILLVVMTLVGLSGLRSVTLEERMTANTFDRSISFQGAEAALKQAEAFVEANKALATLQPAAGTACSAANGVCGAPNPATLERWLDNTSPPWFDATALANGGISITPQYMIEYLGNGFTCSPGVTGSATNCSRYRITARSNAGADRSVVILQSIYAPL